MPERYLGRDPERSRRTLTALLAGYGTVIVVLLALIALRLWSEEDLSHYREVRAFVEQTYAGDTDRNELVHNALVGMLDGLDPYSRYYPPRESERMERETRGIFKGIGVVFRDPTASAFTGQILFPLPGTPAELAGLAVGDRIVEVDGEPVEVLGLDGLRASLNAESTDPRRLLIEDLTGERRLVDVIPEELTDPSLRRRRMLAGHPGIAHISLLSFSRETPEELDMALAELSEAGMRALVLDLRRNHGGVLSSAVAIARRFVTKGTIVSTEGHDDVEVYEAVLEEATHAGLPVVVLVDGESASASEVLAAALQENGAGELVGEPTYGKGTVQTIRRFRDQGTVAKVTSARYFTPSHRNLERTTDPERDYGLLPDHGVEFTTQERELVHDWLGQYAPPESARAALRAWEAAEGTPLSPPPPPDRQLDRAIMLLERLLEQPRER